MIESIALHVSAPAAAVASAAAPVNLASVSAADQARFQAALHGLPESSAFAAPTVTAAPTERITAPGDLILRGLDRLRGDYRALGSELDTLANRTDMTPGELLTLQMEVAQVTLGAQLIGQVASSLQQHINSLLKGQ